MKVIYSTQSTVECCNGSYYNNSVNSTYKRYLVLGEDMTVICHSKNTKHPTSDEILDDRIHFAFIKKINSIDTLLKFKKSNNNIIEQQVKNTDVCVIHLPNIHGYNVIKYAEKYNKPYITVIGGCPWDGYWNYNWIGKLIAPYYYFKLRHAQEKALYTIYVTQRFLQNRYPTKGLSIGCSNVNMSTGDNNVLEQRLKKIETNNSLNQVLKIGTAAAIDVPYKGQRYIIEAVARLKSIGINYEYHLAGRGDATNLKTLVEKLGINDRVYFHGELPHGDILKFIDKLDVYAQPSKQEGLPRSVIEAMSRGCLCLGSDIAGIPELLDKEYLFKKGDVSQIVNILKNITYDKLLQQAKRNFNVAKNYDKDVLNKRRADFLLQFKKSFSK